jgi:hypothetical protein
MFADGCQQSVALTIIKSFDVMYQGPMKFGLIHEIPKQLWNIRSDQTNYMKTLINIIDQTKIKYRSGIDIRTPLLVALAGTKEFRQFWRGSNFSSVKIDCLKLQSNDYLWYTENSRRIEQALTNSGSLVSVDMNES